jgi:transcriptional regulator with XRE-family HTH domain
MSILLTSEVLRAARALTGLSQEQVASRAKVGARSLWKAENGETVSIETLLKLQKLYEDLGVEFLHPLPTRGIGVRLKISKTKSAKTEGGAME